MPGRTAAIAEIDMELNPKRLRIDKPGEISSVNSTEITKLYFERPGKSEDDLGGGFSPTFTYTFFGQEEELKGVKQGSLRICFHPASFYAHIGLSLDINAEILRPSILDKFVEKMPKDGWTTNWAEFVQKGDELEVEPGKLGTLEATFSQNGSKLSIYKCSFSNELFKRFHERLQTLLLFFIEGASYIDDKDTKWCCYLMFSDENKEGSKPSLVGYTTLYPFLYFPDRTRLRLSQFLILPPYLRLGLGSQMYRHVYSMVLEDPMIVELTVEDPSTEFAAFRLQNDYAVFKDAIDKDRQAFKFSEIEYELLLQLDLYVQGEHRDSKDFRLRVKKALWRQNKDQMPEDFAQMKDFLQELYEERLDLFKLVLKL